MFDCWKKLAKRSRLAPVLALPFLFVCALWLLAMLPQPSQAANPTALGALIGYTYERTPSGYVCGTTGPSPGQMQMRAVRKENGRQIEFEVEKCDRSDFRLPGRVELLTNGAVIAQKNYSEGDFEIEFLLDPVTLTPPRRGYNDYQAYVFSQDQPTIPKHTGVVRVWEKYDTPTDQSHGLVYSVNPERDPQCGNLVAFELQRLNGGRQIRAVLSKCDGSNFAQGGSFYLVANDQPFLGPISFSSGVREIFHEFDPMDYGLATTSHTYRAIVYTADQPTLAKISGGVSAVGESGAPLYPYMAFDGSGHSLAPYKGVHVALLAPPSYDDASTLARIVAAIDAAYSYYTEMTGREPTPYFQYDGLATVAVVPSTCGAGCAYLGSTGIELQTATFDELYRGVRERNEFDQAVFYELGRNFWFYGDQIDYVGDAGAGSVTTGYAVLMRFLSMDATGVAGGPFNGRTFAEFKSEVQGMLNRYLADDSLRWENTLRIGEAPANPLNLGATDLFASFVFELRRRYGDEYIRRLWGAVGQRPLRQTTHDAVDNFVIAASIAADESLLTLFESEWRWPVSANARQSIEAIFASTTPTPTATATTPVANTNTPTPTPTATMIVPPQDTPTTTPTATTVAPQPADVRLEAQTVSGQNGATVTLLVQARPLSERNLAALTLELRYDPTVAEAVGCLYDPDRAFGNGECNPHFDADRSGTDAVRVSVASARGVTAEAAVMQASFRLVGQTGSSAPVTLSISTVADTAGRALASELSNGRLTVVDPDAAQTLRFVNGENSGGPGSHFLLIGEGFPPNASLTIFVNGATLITLTTDASGRFYLLIITPAEMPAGTHTVTTSEPGSPSAAFAITQSAPLPRPADPGDGAVWEMEYAPGAGRVFLPLVTQ